MTDAILNITDGTTTISLINPSSGFHLVNWVPAITDYKGGGVFQDPPLADWRQLRVAKWATAQENFGLTINGQNPDNVAYNLQELRRLLEKANAYWTTDWQNTPVYIEAKAKCETNTRYCLVVKGRLGNDQNYYRQPFTGIRTTMQDLPLIIERRAWQNTIPGQGNDVAISASEDDNSRTYGVDTATNAAATVVTNSGKRNDQNITHVYLFDNSGASFSSNLLDAALPQALLPASTTVDDIIYFGIDTSTFSNHLFDNLIFNITTAAASAGTYDGTWEYFNGSVWSGFGTSNFEDKTESGSSGPFTQTGIVSFTFEPPIDWASTTINSVDARWVRMRVTTLSGAFTRPVQSTRIIYSAIWDYVNIASGQIGGDIPALSQVRLWPLGQMKGVVSNNYLPRFMIGLRSNDRGSSFVSKINLTGTGAQNPSGITVTPGGGTTTTVTANTLLPTATGFVIRYVPAGVDSLSQRFTVAFNSTMSPQYVGSFRCFMRVKATANTANYTFQLRTETDFGTTVFTSDSITNNAWTGDADDGRYRVIDFGQVDLTAFAGTIKDSSESAAFKIAIDIGSDAAGTLYCVDLWLVPIDEWSGVFTANGILSGTFITSKTFLVDSVENPQKAIRSLVHDSSELVVENLRSTANGYAILQANTGQRLYIMSFEIGTSDELYSLLTYPFAVQVNAAQRYLSLRGNR